MRKGAAALARSSNQKLKPLYLMEYLLQHSDDAHPVPMSALLDYLESKGISAERKSVYDDLEALRTFGLDILQTGAGQTRGYYVAGRQFELPELKLLVDSVQSSKFITRKKTEALIRKIERLCSVHEARLLQRQVFVQNRIKAMNESIYYNVDEIHAGISQNQRIRFHYFEYTVSKERLFRKGGAFYEVSPFALTWDNENYYLVAFDSSVGQIRHYRVDKMTDISVLDKPRDGMVAYRALDMAVYTRQVFGMFSGSVQPVTMRFQNHLVGVVLDRLGQEVMLIPDGGEHFTVTAEVAVSPQFFAWMTGFGTGAQIVAPPAVRKEMGQYIHRVAEQYEA